MATCSAKSPRPTARTPIHRVPTSPALPRSTLIVPFAGQKLTHLFDALGAIASFHISQVRDLSPTPT